jgi:hypothetical protein
VSLEASLSAFTSLMACPLRFSNVIKAAVAMAVGGTSLTNGFLTSMFSAWPAKAESEASENRAPKTAFLEKLVFFMFVT